MKLIYSKSALKCDSFDVGIDIKIPFFRVSVTIEPGRGLLQFVTANCLMYLPLKLKVELSHVMPKLVKGSASLKIVIFRLHSHLVVEVLL